MKHIKSLLFMLLYASIAFSQNNELDKSVLECRYHLIMHKDTIHKLEPVEDDMVLRIGKTTSQFFSRHTFYHDSLWAYPDGREIAEEFSLNSLWALDGSTPFGARTTKDYLYKNYPKGKLTTYAKDFIKVNFYFEEDYSPQEWIIGDSIKQVLGYNCKKAESYFRGRHWIAWFAMDIPIADGPWKLGSLPGMIMEDYDRGKQYYFVTVGLEQVEDDPIVFSESVKQKDKYREIDRRELFRAEMNQLKNGASIMEAESGVAFGSNKPVYMDLIERDYR